MIQVEDGLSCIKISFGSKKVNPYEEKNRRGVLCDSQEPSIPTGSKPG